MAQVCVSRPIRGDCGALKRQELKTGVSDRGGWKAAAVDSLRELMCFWSIKVCKPILLVTQNKKYDCENEHNICPLRHM